MRTVSIFKNGTNQAIRFPKEMEFSGVSELEITKIGDRLILQPVRPSWLSFATCERASDDFMIDQDTSVINELCIPVMIEAPVDAFSDVH